MPDATPMRTTRDLDADSLESAQTTAEQRGLSIGAVDSDLAGRSLESSQPITVRNGIRLFPVREGAQPVTPELIESLLDEA